jgi:hypothetical protein
LTEVVAPILEAVLVEALGQDQVITVQEQAIAVEVRTETVIVAPEPEAVIIEVRRGPRGLQGDKGDKGDDYPEGTNTGDIIRYNAVTGNWESCAEPFEFKGIVLVPMALPGGAVAEGMVGYNAADKGVYVQID